MIFDRIISWFADNKALFIEKLPMIIIITCLILLIIFILIYFKSKRRRRHFAFHWHHLMYQLGLRKTISRRYIGHVHVHECYDPLVHFIPNKKIFLNKQTLEEPTLIRKKVLNKIIRVANSLPNGVNIKVYKTFTSKQTLNESFQIIVNRIMEENPTIGRHEAMRMAKYQSNDPSKNMGGHETGAALDIAFCDNSGNDFDYGSRIFDRSTPSYKNVLTKEQRKNRRYLVKKMKRQGFVNFPAQWWHFSYGDRMWAAYKGKRNGGIYSAAETNINGNYQFAVPVKK
ncbi:MAG: M15 family metallopeptidase [Candidatus Limimorpha sp.]